MKIVGLITEYNPFHNGHKFHLETAKRLSGADYVVSIMSGNFIQRGEPALLNKWSRTKMALLNGVDLVIELPVGYAIQSAEYFAYGAVKILESLKIVDAICFGSEYGDITPLQSIAHILAKEPPEVSQEIKSLLNKGNSFPVAREKAVITYLSKRHTDIHPEEIMSSPNNILGIEYMKALYKLNSSIIPLTIQRYKAGYHTLESRDEIASATAIRNMLNEGQSLDKLKNFMPPQSHEHLCDEIDKGQGPIFMKYFNGALMVLLRKLSPVQLSTFPDVNEGLENRIHKAAHTYNTVEEVINAIKTKRYTRTRLQRIMINILLGITRDMMDTFQQYGGPQYMRVLGMNNKGKEIIKRATQEASLPLIIKSSSYKQSCNPLLKQMIELDFLATDLYTLHYPALDKRMGRMDYLTSPIIVNS